MLGVFEEDKIKQHFNPQCVTFFLYAQNVLIYLNVERCWLKIPVTNTK